MPTRGPGLSEEQFRRIADAVPALVALYSLKTAKYLYVNRAARSVLGFSSNEFVDGGLAFAVALVHPDDVQPLLAKNQAVLDEANEHPGEDEPIVPFEYRMRHKDGNYRWVRTDGTVFGRDAEGRVELVLNVTVDITAQKRTEMQLKRSLDALEERLEI